MENHQVTTGLPDPVRDPQAAFSLTALAAGLRDTFPDHESLELRRAAVWLTFADAEFTIRILSGHDGPTLHVAIFATFRASRDSGGTWWTSWDIPVRKNQDQPLVSELAREIRNGRFLFHRLLSEHGSQLDMSSLPAHHRGPANQ